MPKLCLILSSRNHKTMSLKIGVIGAGGMLQYHHAGFVKAGAEVTAVCDMSEEAAKAAADIGIDVGINNATIID